jgi:hypothetical protein
VSTEPKLPGIFDSQPRIRVRLSEDTLVAVEAELPPGGTIEGRSPVAAIAGTSGSLDVPEGRAADAGLAPTGAQSLGLGRGSRYLLRRESPPAGSAPGGPLG